MAQFLDPNQMMFTSFEPKLRNRFTLEMDGIPTFLVKKCGRPKATTGTVTMNHMNVDWKTAGKTKWEPVDVEIYDSIAPSGMQIIMEQMRLHHESVTGRDNYADVYKKDATFSVIGPPGDIIEQWTLKGAWITNFDGGEFDFSTEDEAATISFTMEYDYSVMDF